MDFENTKVHGVHMSRYLASYYNGLSISFQCHKGVIKFKRFPYYWEWLEELTFEDGSKLTEDEIEEIYRFTTCGKMEFEKNMRNFVRKRC